MPELHGQLNLVRETGGTCQHLAKKSYCFRVSMPCNKCICNRVVGMDIMKLDEKPVLHVVDCDSKFSVAIVFDGESSSKAWEAHIACWAAF